MHPNLVPPLDVHEEAELHPYSITQRVTKEVFVMLFVTRTLLVTNGITNRCY